MPPRGSGKGWFFPMTPPKDAWTEDRLAVALDLIGSSGGGPRVIPVVGESMVPTLSDGDAVLVDLESPRPRIGDVVVFRTRDDLVVHRYLGAVHTRRNGRHLRLRGDGRPTFDPPVTRAQILGIVRAVERGGVWWDLDRSGARVWGVAVASHDHFWGGALAVLRRARGGSSRAEGWIARVDREMLRLADRVLFGVFHHRVPEPPPPSRAGRASAGALL